MAKLKIGDRVIRVHNLQTVHVDFLAEFQRQSGMKMSDIRDVAANADALTPFIVTFLSLRQAGMPANWEELKAGGMAGLGEFIQEPGDDPAGAEGEEDPNPPQPVASETPDDATGSESSIPE